MNASKQTEIKINHNKQNPRCPWRFHICLSIFTASDVIPTESQDDS